nr:superoxide dismutase [Mn] mitochondrial [Halisarca dujardinii]
MLSRVSSRVWRLGASARVSALASSGSARQRHTLPDLPYDYNALEPHISTEIMTIHHSKHHAAYVDNLVVAEQKLAEAMSKNDMKAIVQLEPAVRFNGGGHINHSIFWTNLSPNGGGEPQGELMDAIKRDFGSFEEMKAKLSTRSATVQGSGWGWLGYNKEFNRLEVATCPNQDPLESTTGLVPLLGFDVWEHAYYLQYQNMKPKYITAIWNVVNWSNIAERFRDAQ